MPNWCWSNITFYSKDKSVIEDFHKKLTEWTDAPSLAPTAWDGDSSWLGNILKRTLLMVQLLLKRERLLN